jgi:hypothetical protein
MDSTYINFSNAYAIDLKIVTWNIQELVLVLFRHFGALGNIIFFTCSAWFLCETNKVKYSKIVHFIRNHHKIFVSNTHNSTLLFWAGRGRS